MAPEVVRRWEEEESEEEPETSYNQKADLWSVGCIVYVLDQKRNLFAHSPASEEQANQELDRSLQGMTLESSGVHFITRLLQFEGTRRPTAEAALKDLWLINLWD